MSGYSSSDDEEHSGDEPDWPQMFVDRKNMPPDAIPGQIKNTKYQIAKLLQISNLPQPDIDAGIAEKMTENGIEINPNDTSLKTQLQQLTALKGKLEALQKKGGKRRKSKRYYKSKKQRKTKTKRRLRRSYKYK
jgi:hypothetical protein